MPLELPRTFRFYVTHVEGAGHFLKICGQLDQPSSLMVESLVETARDSLEKGVGSVPPAAIQNGIICAAKYKDGAYYRAKIISTANLCTGLVGVHFIDYGNRDLIPVSAIRFLDNYDPMFLRLPGQVSEYYLARIMHPSGVWEESVLQMLQSLLCYSEYTAMIESSTHTLPIISIQFKDTDFSAHLISNRLGVAIPVPKQKLMLAQTGGDNLQAPNWQQNFMVESPSYPEQATHINQNLPSKPASAMFLQRNPPVSSMVSAPLAVSQRPIVNNSLQDVTNVRAPMNQLQAVPNGPLFQAIPSLAPPHRKLAFSLPAKKSPTYKSCLLECNSQHKVFVSFVEEGPELFSVQLVDEFKNFQNMMDNINRRSHTPLKELPMIGTVCLGRISEDRIICRAIVTNLSGSQCKLFFVDLGDTETVSYYDVFDIPEEFVKPNVFAMRFCLSGVKKLERGPCLKEAFKQLVFGKLLTLRVVAPEGPPLIQYGELYLDNQNVLELLLSKMEDKLQFKWMNMLQLGSRYSVLVSYVDSCLKFHVQLCDQNDNLNAVMEAVKAHCESTSSPGALPVGAACCARFPDDGNWYRACVRSTKDDKIVVTYVDYGNEQEVAVSDLRTITPKLIKLPAQAMKCALKGFESSPIDTKSSNLLEKLALEKTLIASVVGVLSNNIKLVTLIDDTVSPPLDVAREIMKLLQPSSSVEVKPPVLASRAAPAGSPAEAAAPANRKGFQPEERAGNWRIRLGGFGILTNFKEEYDDGAGGVPLELVDFGENTKPLESFEHFGTSRYNDKFQDRPDYRPSDRRGGRTWDPSVPIDDWREALEPRQAARDRRNHGPDLPEARVSTPDWTGVGKQLIKAAEAASADAQKPKGPRQERRKREKKSNKQDEWEVKKPEERARRDRSERRDTHADRNGDGRTDKKEYGRTDKKEFPKRERSEADGRGDRQRSGLKSRERASCSFGSDRSGGSGPGAGRAPHKPRAPHTPAPAARELADPVPLDTPFAEPAVEPGAQHEVAITWIISPHSFYTQILALQPKFLEMMHRIPELYKGVRSYAGGVGVGASVLARYPADGVLYRATVVAVQPLSKFVVQYVDFGNKQLVDAKDIWQLERQLMELPKMAVHCSLLGVAPKEGEWRADPELDLCFNAPRYQCVFSESASGQQRVSLWNNGAGVADALVDKGLAVRADAQPPVTLKDEAVDLTIIVGQQIPCRVTHVQSFDKFYVQLDLEKAALVEQAVAEFDAALLTPLTADSLAAGVHCTVRHEGRVFRAILQDAEDAARVLAVLPDYGRTITTSLDHLMILPTELSVYYYQSLECCLNNYTAESRRLLSEDVLRARLVHNKFIVYVDAVEGISLLTTLYDAATGQKLALFEPDEGAFAEVAPLCPRTVFNYNFGLASVQHLQHLNEIHLQRADDVGRVQALLDSLFSFYEEGAPEPLTEFAEDTLCAAKSADENWYRAVIVSASDDAATVQFPDYGNTETVPKSQLKKLDPRFYEPCAQALVAGLGLEALQESALARLAEWTADREVQVTLAFGADGWLASLHLDGVDLSMRLVEENLAAPRAAAEPEQGASAPAPAQDQDQDQRASAPPPPPPPPGCTQAYISHIDTPGHFWLQMADRVSRIDQIQAELQAGAASYPELASREMGALCVAKYSADELWYRAQVLDLDADITTVRFVDYGNTDVLDNQPGVIKEMPQALRAVEPLALRSSVNAVPTGTGQWSEAAADSFAELVGDTEAPVDALVVLKDDTTYVDLFVAGENLTDRLVALGHAARAEQPECGDLPSCFASHVNSPSEFWIQLESATPELQWMEAAMVDAEGFPALPSREEGVLCAAKYPEDEAWYRAQVIVDGSEGTEVLFMDYGNASIATELRSLPQELKGKPALSRKCALQKPRDIKAWSRKSETRFNELAAEGATIFKVQFIASGDVSIVELFLDARSVTEQLVGLCEECPSPQDKDASVEETTTDCGSSKSDPNKEHDLTSKTDSNDQLDNDSKESDSSVNMPEEDDEFEDANSSILNESLNSTNTVIDVKTDEPKSPKQETSSETFENSTDIIKMTEDDSKEEPLVKCLDVASAATATSKLNQHVGDSTTCYEFLDTTNEPVLVIPREDISSASKLGQPDNVVMDSKEKINLTATPEAFGQHTEDECSQISETEDLMESTPENIGTESSKAMQKEIYNADRIESNEHMAESVELAIDTVSTVRTIALKISKCVESDKPVFSATKPENVDESTEEVSEASIENAEKTVPLQDIETDGKESIYDTIDTTSSEVLPDEMESTNKLDPNEKVIGFVVTSEIDENLKGVILTTTFQDAESTLSLQVIETEGKERIYVTSSEVLPDEMASTNKLDLDEKVIGFVVTSKIDDNSTAVILTSEVASLETGAAVPSQTFETEPLKETIPEELDSTKELTAELAIVKMSTDKEDLKATEAIIRDAESMVPLQVIETDVKESVYETVDTTISKVLPDEMDSIKKLDPNEVTRFVATSEINENSKAVILTSEGTSQETEAAVPSLTFETEPLKETLLESSDPDIIKALSGELDSTKKLHTELEIVYMLKEEFKATEVTIQDAELNVPLQIIETEGKESISKTINATISVSPSVILTPEGGTIEETEAALLSQTFETELSEDIFLESPDLNITKVLTEELESTNHVVTEFEIVDVSTHEADFKGTEATIQDVDLTVPLQVIEAEAKESLCETIVTNSSKVLPDEIDSINKLDPNNHVTKIGEQISETDEHSGTVATNYSSEVPKGVYSAATTFDGEDINPVFSSSIPRDADNIFNEDFTETTEITYWDKKATVSSGNSDTGDRKKTVPEITVTEILDYDNEINSNLIQEIMKPLNESHKPVGTVVTDGITTSKEVDPDIKPNQPENDSTYHENSAVTSEITNQDKVTPINDDDELTKRVETNCMIVTQDLFNTKSGHPVETTEEKNEFEDVNKLNSPPSELDKRLESIHTVIKNNAIEVNLETLDIMTNDKTNQLHSRDKDVTSATFEKSTDTVKMPEKDDSKDSINTGSFRRMHKKSRRVSF